MTATLGSFRTFEYWARRYRRSWRRSLLPSLIGPCLYLVVMGKVLGGLVLPGASSQLGGLDYLGFVAPAVVAVAAMLTASTEATSQVFNAMHNTHTYSAQYATPLRVADIVGGHLLFVAVRVATVSAVLGVLAASLGAADSWTAVLLVPVGVLTGMAVAAGLAGWSARQTKQSNMLAWQRFGATPMLLFGGAFYSIDQLPLAARAAASLTPVWHGAELARAAAHGHARPVPTLVHIGYLLALAVAGVWFASRALHERLADR